MTCMKSRVTAADMANERYEVVVVGGGPGGYVAGIRLGQHGKKSLVVEREHLGGVCLNWGCIPSKALIHAGNLRHEMSTMGSVYSGAVPAVNSSELQTWKNAIISKQRSGVSSLLKSNKCEHIQATARLKGPHELELSGGGGTQTIEFDNLILATGARVIEIPPFPFSEPRIGYAKDAVSYDPIPERLVIIGGGVIGSELGMAYRKMGAEVTIIEMQDTILPGMDKDLLRPVQKAMRKAGITVLTKAKASKYEKDPNGELIVEVILDNGAIEKVPAQHVLVAVGFRPNTEGLNLEAAGVQLNAQGWVGVDAKCRTNVSHIYAIGDVTGPPLLAHRASHMGEVAADVVAGHAAEFDVVAMPLGVFTDPEVAQAGLSENEAKAKGYSVRTGLFPVAALGRAGAMNQSDGVVKVVIDEASDLILGVGITAYNACDLIAEACLALEMGALAEDLSLTVHVHPTLSEGVMEAAKAARGEALHMLNRRR